MSPSLTPRKWATSSHAVGTEPLALKVRSACRVSAMNAPRSPVTTATRSFIGESQFTRWLVTVPLASRPVTATRSSCSRPLLCALWLDTEAYRDWTTHAVSHTAWVVQSPYASVSSQSAHKSGREHEDLVAVTGRLANGTVTSHLVNWLSPMKERVAVVTGDRGAFIADTLHADLTFNANGSVPTAWDDVAHFRGVSEGDMIRYAIAKPEPLLVEHAAFRDAVLGKDADIVTMLQGLATVTVAEAVIASATEGRTISLPLTAAADHAARDDA